MYRRLGFGALLGATLTVTACNTGGGLVSANNPLNPTPAPTVAATPTPTAGPSAKPTATPTAGPSAKPTATPTAGPTAKPTATPTATPTAAACGAPPPDPNTSTITLTGVQQTIAVPCFGNFTSSASVPASNGKGLTVALASSTDNNLGAVPDSTYGTPIIYTSLQPKGAITFTDSKAAIATTLTSPANIGAPHTYAIQVYVPLLDSAIQTVTGIHPTGHSITFGVAPPGGSFPALEAVVIVYQSS
jgi:hypothetical protein